jgi:hypothetical protein
MMYAGKLLVGDPPACAGVTLVTMFDSPLVLRPVFADPFADHALSQKLSA